MGIVGSSVDKKTAVPCPVGRASHNFPLRISAESARAASAAAMGPASPAVVLGYTTRLTKEAGASTVRLQLRPPPGNRSSGISSAPSSCATVSLRSEGKLAFLAGIAAVLRPETNTILLEVVVFGRPNEFLQELTNLDEEVLKGLFPEGSTVDVRILRSMPFEQFDVEGEEVPVMDGTDATAGNASAAVGGQAAGSSAVDSAEAAPAEAAPTRSAKAEWLAERLLSQSSALESQFGAPRQEVGTEASYEGCEIDGEGVQSWLADAGICIVGEVFFDQRSYAS